MQGFCSHCSKHGTVWRYRIWTVGLRFMDRECFGRLVAMGLDIEPVTTADPREADTGGSRRSTDIRAGLRWLTGRAA